VLILAGTPIGQVADASGRLGPALASADVVAAEDTRRLRRLCADLDVRPSGRVVSYFEGNEERRTDELIGELRADRTVVLVTDAGMPSVSDPGYRLVAAATAEGLPVTAIPGPSAVLTALALSGLPVDRFSFEGFLPRKSGERSRLLGELAGERRTMVFFESPHRVLAALRAAIDAFGPDRPAALCRELTKTYEEVVRRPLSELADWVDTQEHGVRGEVTLVIAGAGDPTPAEVGDEALGDLVADAEAAGLSRRDAIAQVAERTGIRRKRVYDAAHR